MLDEKLVSHLGKDLEKETKVSKNGFLVAVYHCVSTAGFDGGAGSANAWCKALDAKTEERQGLFFKA